MKYLIAVILALTTFNVMAAKVEEERVCIEDQCYTVVMKDISRSHRAMYHRRGELVHYHWTVKELGTSGLVGTTRRHHVHGRQTHMVAISDVAYCEFNSSCSAFYVISKWGGRPVYSASVWDDSYTNIPTSMDIVEASIDYKTLLDE